MKKLSFYFIFIFLMKNGYSQIKNDTLLLKKIDQIDFKLDRISNRIDSFKIIQKVNTKT